MEVEQSEQPSPAAIPADTLEEAPEQRWFRLRKFLWDYGPMGVWLRFRRPVPILAPERFAVLLRALADRRDLPGAILEVGCYRGMTAAEVFRLLKLWDAERQYVCVDTFSGFVPSQFEEDEQLGTPASYRPAFDFNSRRSVERTFRHLGYDIDVVEGDIAALGDDELPREISVCLMDVDLAVPIFEGLGKVLPRMVPGGVILVDDCEEEGETGWRGARIGYKRFVAEKNLPEEYDAGLGIIRVT